MDKTYDELDEVLAEANAQVDEGLKCVACVDGFNEVDVMDEDGNWTGERAQTICVICSGKGVM
jgi:hypothetical protein